MLLQVIVSRKRKAVLGVLTLPLFFALAFFFTRTCYYDDFYCSSRVSAGYARIHPPSTSSKWWTDFFTRLERTRVTAHAAKFGAKAPKINWKPDTKAARPELLKLDHDDEDVFRKSHAAFVAGLREFASHLPYKANTTGIVTTAGVPNFGQAVSLVLMTRQAGSHLPIEIVLDSTSPWVEYLCARTMPRFNATCLFLEDLWAGTDPLVVTKFQGYQFKSVSIIASTFQNVLFLDADCYPMRNPDSIFTPGAEPFTSTGLITWPDFWTQTASPLFYQVAGDLVVPPVSARPSSESGMLVYDKARHADSLLLAAYYNYNGPKYYYPMLTQHGAGEGDRESFLQAALVLDELRRRGAYQQPTAWMRPGVGVKKGYWDVKMTPRVHGRTAKGRWRGMFMMQMDPAEDYRAVMAAVEKAKTGPETKGELMPGKRGEVTSNNTEPSSAPQKDDQNGTTISEDAFLTDSSFLATVGNLPIDHDHGRTMFFHHNGVKLDFTRVLLAKSEIAATDEAGRYVRLWGDPGWIVDLFGHDVEKLLWEASMEVYCGVGLAGQFKRFGEVCARMREIYGQVYR